MKINKKKLCIVGAGGFGREVLSSFKDNIQLFNNKIEDSVIFLDDDPMFINKKILGVPVIQTSEFISSEYEVVVAVGDPHTRRKIVESLPHDVNYITLIHPSAIVMEETEIGEGSIITAGSIVTCNIKIGKHTQLNLNTTVGHDCEIGDYFTTAPGAHISGHCLFGDNVYFGTNASVRQGVKVCDNVTIGMGGVVVKDITEKGIYVGNPLKKLEK